MSYRKIFVFVIALYVCVFSAYTVAIYYYDPMHIISNPYSLFNSSMRYQARGYLENRNVKGLIIGTSLLENTSSDEATAKLFNASNQERFLNISLAGSTLAERKVVLDYAFAHHELKSIIYSLEMSPLIYKQNLVPMTWQKIYNDNLFSVMSVYMKKDYVKCLLSWSDSDTCVGIKKSLDRPSAWIEDPIYKNSFNGVCSWNEISRNILKDYLDTNGKSNELELFDINYLKNYTNRELFSLIDEHKETFFYLVIPPTSAVYYKVQSLYNKEHMAVIKEFITYVANACSKRKNCSLYGFDDTGLSLDLRNYKDVAHYSDRINSLMIDSIKNHEHEVTAENVPTYLKSMDGVIEMANIDAVKAQISQCR